MVNSESKYSYFTGLSDWLFLAFHFIVCDVIKEIKLCNIRAAIKPVFSSDPTSN